MIVALGASLALAGAVPAHLSAQEPATPAFPVNPDLPPESRQFDFWVGEWDVHDPSGAYVGNNVIASEQHGCLLTESWTGARGTTGSSVNYFDKVTDEWVQIWNDATGNQIQIRGGLTDDGMRLTGTIHYIANGTTAPFRGLWTPLEDGRVRQFFEQSNDGGETWQTWFEGFYTRKDVAKAD